MGRLLVTALIIIVSFLAPKIVFAQETEGTEPASQGPETQPENTDVIQGQPDAPVIDNTGIVHTQEDLDPFGMSTLTGSTGSGKREDGSTLGRDTKRKSNLEVNKPREKKEGEETAEETGQGEETVTGSTEDELGPQLGGGGYTSPGKKGNLFTWKDESGVVHVTNDLGSVPPQYQDQIMNGSEKAQTEEPSEP